MEFAEHKSNSPANYAEYLLAPDEEKWEIIDGIPYSMTPAPSTIHQRIVSYLQGEFYVYLKDKKCESFVTPFGVRLLAEEKMMSNREKCCST